MTPEVAFLADLLANHKISTPLRKVIATRIGEVAAHSSFNQEKPSQGQIQAPKVIQGAIQSPSMIAKIEAMQAELVPQTPIVTSPIAAQALASRQAAVAQATSGKSEPGRTSPKKF